MTTTVEMQSEYRNLPILSLAESAANPRRTFDETALNELADYVAGHIIGFLFRWPFCGRDGDEPRG